MSPWRTPSLPAFLLAPVLCLGLSGAAVAQGEAPVGTTAPEPDGTAAAVLPETPRAAQAVITPDLLRRDTTLDRWLVDLAPDPGAVDRPTVGPNARGDEARILRGWRVQGRAAGLAGVFYDNRDGGHSGLTGERFPQLTHLVYAPELIQQGLDKALAGPFLFQAPVIGNASMAVTGGNNPRSLPRLAMTSPGGALAAFIGYVRNHLYIYPAHRDYRETDLLPAVLPYFVVSRGSSGSDQPFLDAVLLSLGAFQPETRARLEAEGLIAPTLVMLLRRSLTGVTDYLSPSAHPAVFDSERLRRGLMMQLAQAMAPDEIPPLVRLQVEREEFSAAAGFSGESERLFDTPSAVARLWRGWAARREMVISAARTGDPNGRPLEFHWVLVSGDPERVRIEPLDAAGTRARVTIAWHDAPVPPPPGGLPGARVDIAVIAWNGAQYSAPAMVTVAFPAHERRTYGLGPNGQPLLAAVDYDAAARNEGYDAVLWWSAPWRDEAVYDRALRLVAWRRTLRDGTVATVTPDAPGTYGGEIAYNTRTLTWSPEATGQGE